eukprot:10432386-Heterocapsa_arctica.AAC.1
MADMQAGVRKDEPAVPIRRWRRSWDDQSSAQAIAEELAEDLEEGSDSGDINILSDDIARAQKHLLLNNSDW